MCSVIYVRRTRCVEKMCAGQWMLCERLIYRASGRLTVTSPDCHLSHMLCSLFPGQYEIFCRFVDRVKHICMFRVFLFAIYRKLFDYSLFHLIRLTASSTAFRSCTSSSSVRTDLSTVISGVTPFPSIRFPSTLTSRTAR